MAKVEAVNDYTLAESYFNEFVAEKLSVEGLTDRKVDEARLEFVDSVVYTEKMQQIRDIYGA